ncbi:MAG: hypothetical protein IPO00_06580 [Betaproteobacteria bacterium]|nr:hypothetical protein [Betaproteobacteria bacterium]
MTPTLDVREGLANESSPFGRHGAVRREFPTSPPQGGAGPWGGPTGDLTP